MERRTLPRYACPDLVVHANPTGLRALLERSSMLQAVDFNRAGLAFHDRRRCRIGERLHLTLRFGALLVPRLACIVQNCRTVGASQRIGVRFDTADAGHATFERLLLEIESILAARAAAGTSMPAAADRQQGGGLT